MTDVTLREIRTQLHERLRERESDQERLELQMQKNAKAIQRAEEVKKILERA
jgi:hypothetical protein